MIILDLFRCTTTGRRAGLFHDTGAVGYVRCLRALVMVRACSAGAGATVHAPVPRGLHGAVAQAAGLRLHVPCVQEPRLRALRGRPKPWYHS